MNFKLILIFSITFTVVSTSNIFAEEIPDYFNPYAPIYTDREVYTWTDKVHITVVAPSWNANRNGIDSIGTQERHFIRIYTGEHSLEPYKLTETEPSSGIFTGEVTLTGFLHDVDDDGNPDTNPRTTGGGPTNGLLEVERDGGLTISFEFADGVVLTTSAMISWNVGEIIFDRPVFLIGDTARIQVVDPDMNLNPEAVDRVKVEISSDSDTAGITVNAIETDDDSGLFDAEFFFTQTSVSSGNRLFAMPDDSIYAKYKDNTLPLPYSIQDDLDVQIESKLESEVMPIQRISIEDVFFTDSFGILTEPTIDKTSQIVGRVSNNQSYDQSFVYIIQVKDGSKSVVSLSWMHGELTSNQSLELSQSWTPTETDNYSIETFVWKSLNNRVPLSPNSVLSYIIEQ
ncbi:hypothetical protein [Nitrosopumilus sp.]|uniref:hypothetical protein n=1 Tax=Nitrosopumilus sp. TaxID=2024843 RepID=UPI00292F0854|nr:hypothetical protein [Nitrosopumilus sp.]